MNSDSIFYFETREENGWQVLYASLVWDRTKYQALPFYSLRDLEGMEMFAKERAVGMLWLEYAKDIIEHIQQETKKNLRNISISDIPVGDPRDMLITVHRRGKAKLKLYLGNDEEDDE